MASGAATPPRRSGLVQTRLGDTWRKLIEVARELWNEGSFEEALEATTVADIARAAGMSKGAFYHHFASKQEILLEMAWATTRKIVKEADAGIRRGTPMFELAGQLMRSMARRISRTPKALVFRVVGEWSPLSPDVVARPAGVGVGFEPAVIRYGQDRAHFRTSWTCMNLRRSDPPCGAVAAYRNTRFGGATPLVVKTLGRLGVRGAVCGVAFASTWGSTRQATIGEG